MKRVVLPLTLLLLVSSQAFAEKLEIKGEVNLEFARHEDTAKPIKDKNSYKYAARIDFNYKFDKHLTAFASIGGEQANGRYDFLYKDYGATENVFDLDRFGLTYQNANIKYTVGQQVLTLGSLGIMFDNSAYYGKKLSAVKALKIDAKAGVVNLGAAYAIMNKGESSSLEQDVKFATFNFNLPVASNTNLGFTYAYANSFNTYKARNVYELQADYSLGKVKLFGSYLWTSAATANKSHIIGLEYAPTNKDLFIVFNHKVEGNGELINGMTGLDNNQKGFYYIYLRNINKNLKAKFMFIDNKYVNGGGYRKTYQVNMFYNF